MSSIQWYPGHMTRARRQMEEAVRSVDIIIEVRDARIPRSSENPDIKELAGKKPRMIVLTKADLANEDATKGWTAYFKQTDAPAIACDAKRRRGTDKVIPELQKLSAKSRGKLGTLRVMIAGIPNSGKSALINALSGRKAAKAENRPGVTRGRQWISLGGNMMLLDTPGILWPKIDSDEIGYNLAFTGAIKDDILDREDLAARLMQKLHTAAPEMLNSRYSLDPKDSRGGWDLLCTAAENSHFLISGGEPDTERMSRALLDAFRSGKLGRITLELPEEGRA